MAYLGSRGPGSAADELAGEGGGGAGQPAVGEGVLERGTGDLGQLDEDGGVTVEVGNGEKAVRVGGQQGFLLGQVFWADSQDRAVRRGLVAEAFQVRLTERALPGERLAGHVPGAGA